MSNINFVALDFETATASRASVCEVGLCFVRDGQIMSSPSYLMRPPHCFVFFAISGISRME